MGVVKGGVVGVVGCAVMGVVCCDVVGVVYGSLLFFPLPLSHYLVLIRASIGWTCLLTTPSTSSKRS